MEEKGKLTLKNGVDVYWVHYPSRTSTYGEIHVCSGSVDDPYDKRGLAHFVEHMTFHGSKRYQSRHKQEARARELGFEERLNGGTNAVCIKYPFCVKTENVASALEFLNDLIFSPIFRSVDVDHERRIIADESRRNSDQIDSKVYSLFYQTFYRGTPLEELPLGREDHIDSFARGDVVNFHRKHFHSGNTRLYLSGNMENTLGKLEDAFSDIASKKPFPPFKLSLPILASDQIYEHRIQGLRECYGNILFRAPECHLADSPALVVVSELLNDSKRFGLMENIRHKLGLAYGIGSNYNRNVGAGGYFNVGFSCGPKDLEKVREEMRRLTLSVNPSQSELDSAKKRLLQRYAAGDNDQGERFSQFVVESTTPFSFKKDKEETAALSRKQVVDAVEKYLINQPSQTLLVVPQKS